MNVVGKNNEDADVTLSSAEKTLNITPTSLAGSWTAPARTTVKIGRDNYQSTFDLANGFSWKATNDKTIWKDGSANTTDWGASPLTVFGVDLPTFTVASADQQYVSITESGVLSLTETGRNLDPSAKKTITVTINAAPGWGTITGYDAGKIVTVEIKLGTASDQPFD